MQATKEAARDFIQQRQAAHRPLPSMQEIRTMLGWDLVDAARMEPARVIKQAEWVAA